MSAQSETPSAGEVFRAFLRLGLTSFGGPVAHLSYFRAEFVERRRWLDEKAYADIVALCQFLPGPASSQVGATLGFLRAGFAGGLAAWLGFTLPSALALIAFAEGVGRLGDIAHVAWLHGLKIVAVAVVAQAVWAMAKNLCPDRARASLAVAAAVLTLALPSAAGQIGAILAGALFGRLFLVAATAPDSPPLALQIRKTHAVAAFGLFVVLLAGLPLLAHAASSHALDLFDSFLPFGRAGFRRRPCRAAPAAAGGRAAGLDRRRRLSRRLWRGAGRSRPALHFRRLSRRGDEGGAQWLLGGLFCLLAIYLPSFLLLVAALPFWDGLRRRAGVQSALMGVNAAVVGLLLGALYKPVWTSAIFSAGDFALVLVAFLALSWWKTPPWLVVLLGASAAALAG